MEYVTLTNSEVKDILDAIIDDYNNGIKMSYYINYHTGSVEYEPSVDSVKLVSTDKVENADQIKRDVMITLSLMKLI